MNNSWNGSHRLPAYFEWWYFHFASPNGPTINMVIHETDIFGLSIKPYLSMSLLVPGQSPRYFRRDLHCTPNPNQSFLRLEEIITETDNHIALTVHFPDGTCFKGEIVKQAPPLVIQDGILYQDGVNGHKSKWIVPVPHGTFTAVIGFDDEWQHLTGVAYHDHQWGTLPIQKFVSDWVWGHFSDEQISVTLFQILTQQGHYIERVALITPEGRFVGTAIDTTYLTTLFQTRHLGEFNDKVCVSFLNQLATVSFKIAPENLMRNRLNESHDDVNVSYLRWSTTADYHAGRTHQSLYGITEYIRFRPVTYGGISQTK